MALKLSNNASTILAADIDAEVTTVPIWTADAGLFPSLDEGDWFPITVYDQDGNMEIMKVTARVDGDLTVERGQEGTTAKSFSANDRVDIRVTGAVFAYLEGLFDIFTPFGTEFVKALDAAAALNLLGGTSLGKALFSIGSAAAARSAIGAVSSSGDTMTGALTIGTTNSTKIGNNGNISIGGDSYAQVARSNSGTYNLNITGTANNATTFQGLVPNNFVRRMYGSNISIGWSGGGLDLIIDATGFGDSWPIYSKVTQCVHNSGTVEFGWVTTNQGGTGTADIPSPYVMTGLRKDANGVWLRGVTMRSR